MKSICLFNHKGGVSKTTTAFNLGWVLADKGKKVMLVDLDSQCNLTGLIIGLEAVNDDHMESFYSDKENLTMKPIVDALINGMNPDVFINQKNGKLYKTKNKNLFLLPGHLDVSDLDSQISVSFKIASGIPATKNIPGNLPEVIQKIAKQENIDIIIYDLSPNVGGLNEVALMSSDYFIVPTSPDYFCLQSIGSLEKNIVKWYVEIKNFKKSNAFDKRKYPIKNSPIFLGVIQQRYRPRNEGPAKSFGNWILKIREEVNKKFIPALKKIGLKIEEDKWKAEFKDTDLHSYDLANISDFNSLIAISQNLSKPIFSLTDDDIKQTGKVFGHAEKTMIESRDVFKKTFDSLGDHIINLIY